MAEREGFEPSRELALPYRFSKPTPSASWVPLLRRDLHTYLVLPGKPKALAWCYVAPLNFAKNLHCVFLQNWDCCVWRREWDSNPRYRCRHNSFQDYPLQPLEHLSLSILAG